MRNSCTNPEQKESDQKRASVNYENYFPRRKSFCFSTRSKTTITVSHPKGLTWHFIETKAIKHDYYSSIIMWTHKNSKDKYWVVS